MALSDLYPEVHDTTNPSALVVVEVPDLEAACARLRASGAFMAEEARESTALRVVVFKTSAGNEAVIVASTP